MPVAPKKLWAARLVTTPEAADTLSEVFSEALSLSVMAPPRTGRADLEAIYDHPPEAADLQRRLAIMASLLGSKPPKLIIEELPKLDWLKKVSEDFPPLPIARWVVFGAQHKKRAAEQKKIPLQIDATSAFGTGEHPTTRGCLLMLDRVLKSGLAPKNMLDVGCGSGILAMAFAKAARGKAVGVELDPDSVTIAQANIRANGLRPFMQVALGNGYHAALVRRNGPYDLIMANIFAGPLCEMAYDLKRHLKPGGLVILSGLLNHQANRVLAAHRLQGLHLVRHMKIGEWSILCLRRLTR